MVQSVSRRSRVGMVVKIAVAMLLSLAGLTIVGVDSAFAATGPPTVTGLANGLNETGTCTAGQGYSNTANGGNQIAICGDDFGVADNTTTSVTIGGLPAKVVEVASNSRMFVDVPPAANSTAAVDVIVTNTALTTSTTSTCTANPGCVYTYTWAPPTVSAVGMVAVTGVVQSGANVTATAAGTWTDGQVVSLGGFGDNLTSGVYTISTGGTGSFIFPFAGVIATAEPGTGIVSPTPAGGVGSVSGGTEVVIGGTNLSGASSVMFGTNPATSFTSGSGTQITAIAPASTGGATGPVDITVTNPSPTSPTSPTAPLTDTFSYIGTPTVTGVTTQANPAGGPTGGGTQVTIAGTGFNDVTAVDFGSTPATSFLVNSLDSITAIAPAGTGNPDITVVAALGTSATNADDVYTYNGTLTATPGTASYSNSPGTEVAATGTSQSSGIVTVTAEGSWTAGNEVGISGFTNGLTGGTYAIATGTVGSFTIPFAGPTTGSGTGSVLQLNTTTPSAITATSQSGSTVTLDSVGTWYTGQSIYLTGFTNGISTGNYTLTGGGNGSFTISGTTTGTSTGTAVPYQQESFNAATLVTGGTSIGAVTVANQPTSGGGTVTVVGTQLLYTPAQPDPTFYTTGSGATQTTTWLTTVSTTGTQTATIQICEAAPNASTCTTAVMSYIVGTTGFYMGNQLSAAGQLDTVVEDTGAGTVISNSTPEPGTTFTSTIAPPSTLLPSVNSGFVVSGIGGYHSITPVPSGLTLVPGTLVASGGDTAATGAYTATLCTAATGFVAGTCTANNATNFDTPYPYIETSLNVARLIAGGSQLSLPTITATWTVGSSVASGTQISSTQTEFAVTTVVQTIGDIILDAYPTNLASFLDTGLNAPVPTYTAPSPRWTITVGTSGPTAPTITSADATTFTVGTAGSFTVTANGSPAPTFSETGALPSGVSLDSTTGVLSGTPAAGTAGSYPIVITASNGVSPDATQSFTLTVNQAPAITSAASTTFKVGTAGTFTVTATGSPAPTFSETGALPSGVSLNSTTGVLSGTPAAGTGGSYPVTITATNTVSAANQSFTLTVDQAPAITSGASATFAVGTAGSFTVTGTGFPAPTFSETGALPSGVSLDSTTGVLSGTPAAGSGGSYSITVTASNGVSPDATQSFTLSVNQAPAITSADTASFLVGTAGSFQVVASGFPASTFSETGTLPGGLAFSTGGLLSGTPIIGSTGTYTLHVTASNGISPDATQTLTVTVSTTPIAPTITSAANTTFTVGSLGTFTVTADGNPAPTYSETGALPGGVSLDSTSGVLSGTPASGSAGSYPITITASNGVSPDATQSFTLTVQNPTAPTITSAASTRFTVGSAGTFTVTTTGNPTPAITHTGSLPSGVTLVDNGNGTATLSGTPAAGTGGTYTITITATNTATAVNQTFTLTVDQAPAITSADTATFVIGTATSFTVTTVGNPASLISMTGTLPTGVTFVDNGNGTATLSGTAALGTGGSYPLTLTASNDVSPNATETFTLVVPVPPSPPTVTNVVPGNASVTVTWAPGYDGGQPILSYTATATPVTVPLALLVPGTESCTVPAPATSCTITGLTNGTSYTFTVVATNSQGSGQPSAQSAPATPTANGAIQGYWMATSTGGVFANGAALSYGNPAGLKLNAPIVALTPTPDRKGYWMVGSDGGVFAYGDAGYYGSTGGMHLDAPIVGMASTSDGLGYWLVAADGGVFAYGDAAFAGSTGGQHLNAPVVGIAGNGTGGYWLVAADGGVFAYGTAGFDGSAGGQHLNAPVVGITALANGSGYYLAAADGGVFNYGSAPFLGSASGIVSTPVVGITGGADGGYTLATSNGDVYAYGAGYYGGLGSTPTTGPVIGIAS